MLYLVAFINKSIFGFKPLFNVGILNSKEITMEKNLKLEFHFIELQILHD
jgi:hypothetical protein